MKRSTFALAAVALVATSTASTNTPVFNGNISESEVIAAQRAWCDALVSISKTNAEKGQPAAKALASEIIDAAYGYQMGTVLFKPTLAAPPQTFRTTKEGALAYFVGGDKKYAGDTGFALKDWATCRAANAAIHINGDVATSMGNVMITDSKGKLTTVDKTWKFKKDDAGKLRIVVHHSSLPYAAN